MEQLTLLTDQEIKSLKKAELLEYTTSLMESTRPVGWRGWWDNLNEKQMHALRCATIATIMIFLSVSHLADALNIITSTSWWMCLLMAIGIDVGMIFSEYTRLVSKDRECQMSAFRYVQVATFASCGLNAFAFSHHWEIGTFYHAGGCLFGILLPILILWLGGQAGKLWKESV